MRVKHSGGALLTLKHEITVCGLLGTHARGRGARVRAHTITCARGAYMLQLVRVAVPGC